MSWTDRVRPGAYTSPSGTRIVFQFEDVSRTVTKRTSEFEFAGVNESYIQQNGYGSRKYPLRCYFSGAEHDRIATAFEAALLEHGIGRLEHPFYGSFKAVPIGDITRRDDLKTAANQTVVETTFSTTLVKLYPSVEAAPQDEVLAAVASFDVAAAQRFKAATNLTKVTDQANLKGSVQGLLKSIQKTVGKLGDGVASIRRTMHDIEDTINLGLDTFIGTPLVLAQQVVSLIKAPARAIGAIGDRLEEYNNLADEIFGSEAGQPAEELAGSLGLAVNSVKAANAFHLADLAATSAVAGAIVVAVADPVADRTSGATSSRSANPALDLPGVGARIRTRPQAIAAAEAIAKQFDALVAWRDAGFAALNAVPLGSNRSDPLARSRLDTGEAYGPLQEAVAKATGFLIEISFSSVPERRIVLDRNRTIIDLAAELYGKTDDATLDLLIVSNDLPGDWILEIPARTSIAYYPEAA